MYFILNKHAADYVKVVLSEAALKNVDFFFPILFSKSMVKAQGSQNCTNRQLIYL